MVIDKQGHSDARILSVYPRNYKRDGGRRMVSEWRKISKVRHGVEFSVNDPNLGASNLTLRIVNSEEILNLNGGSITCYPPGNNGGTAFGRFRTFVTGYGQFEELHACMHAYTLCSCA